MSLQCVSILNWPGEELPSTYKECSCNDHEFYREVFRDANYSWVWYNPAKNSWMSLDGKILESIEEEYSKHVKGKRTESQVFHCFGKGYSAVIDYNKMEYTLWIW